MLGRRADGYHEIDTVMQTVDLVDTLVLEEAPRLELTVEGDAPADPENLVWKAAELLGVGARIHLRKRIPPGAGLGGGSSDAAAALRGLDRLHGLGLGEAALLDRAARLGADVPFFLRGGLARCRGVGERVEPQPPVPGRAFLLVVPEFGTSTREIYGAVDPGLTGNPDLATVFLRNYGQTDGSGRPQCFNRLQTVAEARDPRLRRVREGAEEKFGAAFTMTGSGSGYYAPVDRVETRRGEREVLNRIRSRIWRLEAYGPHANGA